MVETYPPEYDYFYSALNYFAEKQGRGFQVSLSISTKIAEPTISNIMNKERLANFDQQVKIAKALEHEYRDFLDFGKKILHSAIGQRTDIALRDIAKARLGQDEPMSYPSAENIRAEVQAVINDVTDIMFSGQHGIISALVSNVREFKRAVDADSELKECKMLISGMQEQMDELNRKVDRFTSSPTTVEESAVS